MANTLSVYDPLFYAQEALIQLEKALGLASRVHRGFDKTPQQRGKVISIRRPSTFTAQNAPGSDQDIEAGEVQITLDQWKEVKFALTDQELSYTGERIVNEHIRPAAYALADAVDLAVAARYTDIPWFYDKAATTEVEDITGTRQVMFDNAVPLDDPEALHLMVNGQLEGNFLAMQIFHAANVAGGEDASMALRRGSLGRRFGFEIFANQNTPSHTKGTASTGALLVNEGSGLAKGATSVNLDAVTVTGTLVAGDTFVIAGNTQRYSVVGGPYTASGNAFANVSFTPAAVQAYADDAAVTVNLDDHVSNLAFHRNCFALAMAPLSDMGNNVGARIATVTDEKTGISLRSRLWYVGDTSTVKVGLDVLFGTQTLDPNLGCRLRG